MLMRLSTFWLFLFSISRLKQPRRIRCEFWVGFGMKKPTRENIDEELRLRGILLDTILFDDDGDGSFLLLVH